jgi:putative DNA primase/helicase
MSQNTLRPWQTSGLAKRGFEQVRYASRGQWLWILSALAPALNIAIERFCRSKSAHVPCPCHGGKDGFRLFNNAAETGGGICNSCGSFTDGFELLCWINGWTKSQCLQMVANQVGGYETHIIPAAAVNLLTPPEPISEWLSKCEPFWRQSMPGLQGQPLINYMHHRGLEAILPSWPNVLHFHPHMYLAELKVHTPCMLALVQASDGTPWTLHRTFITDAGLKAAGQQSKKVVSKRGHGAAIHLFDVSNCPVLNVAEGIETALAVGLSQPDQSVWSCLDAYGLESLIIPDHIQQLVIWADHDKPNNNALMGRGQEAAQRLAARYPYLSPVIYMPETQGHDWLDELLKGF